MLTFARCSAVIRAKYSPTDRACEKLWAPLADLLDLTEVELLFPAETRRFVLSCALATFFILIKDVHRLGIKDNNNKLEW